MRYAARGYTLWMRATILLAAALLLAGCSGSDGAEPEQAPAASSTTKCDGTVRDTEIDGDLVVGRDKSCTLDGVTVEGRVTVSPGASLVARGVDFDEGLSAHGYDRVELRGSSAGEQSRQVDFVLDGGRELVVRGGPVNGQFYVLDTTGRVEISDLVLDLGRVYCARNVHDPVVRNISAETPGVLQGQCAGLKNFGESDF